MVKLLGDFIEIAALVEGGKASGGPPIGPAVGPTGIPIKNVVDKINELTKEFKNLKVPVTIQIDPVNKTFEIKISTPMASALLFKELGISKGSGEPNQKFAGDVPFETIIKIAKMKQANLNALTLKTRVKTIVGTAMSCGLTIEGKPAKTILKEIDDGVYDKQVKED
jgi:large subunit ribosomal protein L11